MAPLHGGKKMLSLSTLVSQFLLRNVNTPSPEDLPVTGSFPSAGIWGNTNGHKLPNCTHYLQPSSSWRACQIHLCLAKRRWPDTKQTFHSMLVDCGMSGFFSPTINVYQKAESVDPAFLVSQGESLAYPRGSEMLGASPAPAARPCLRFLCSYL